MRESSKDKGSLGSRKTSKQVRLHEGAFDRSLKEALRNYEEYSVPSDSREEEDDEDSLGGRQGTNTVLVRDDPIDEDDDSSQDCDIKENEATFHSVESSIQKPLPISKTLKIDSKVIGQQQARVKPA